MNLMIFCRLLASFLCCNAVTVYFASQSIRLAVVTTLACSLLLQMVYFGSVLFLLWRSICACRAEVRVSLSQRSWNQPPQDNGSRNECSDVPQLVPMAACRRSVMAQ